MDYKRTYMLIRELSNANAKKELMSDADFADLLLDEQVAEINRAIDVAGIDRSLLDKACSISPQFMKKTSS